MSAYRRVICAVDQSGQRKEVLRRALRFARGANAQLAVASVVDYQPGFESGQYPIMTPAEFKRETVKHVTAQLSELLAGIEAGPAEILVAAGETRKTLIDMAVSWRADLVIVGAHATLGLLGNDAGWLESREILPFDVLAFETRESFARSAGRMVRALVPSF
ncbi:MAG: universal stress protein [Sulfuricella sp.]|nr:universal stress protein [Sulfuricella sp.]